MGNLFTNGMSSDGKKVAKRQFYPEEIVIKENVEGRLGMRGRRRHCAGLVCAVHAQSAAGLSFPHARLIDLHTIILGSCFRFISTIILFNQCFVFKVLNIFFNT